MLDFASDDGCQFKVKQIRVLTNTVNLKWKHFVRLQNCSSFTIETTILKNLNMKLLHHYHIIINGIKFSFKDVNLHLIAYGLLTIFAWSFFTTRKLPAFSLFFYLHLSPLLSEFVNRLHLRPWLKNKLHIVLANKTNSCWSAYSEIFVVRWT